MDVREYNRKAWNRLVEMGNQWTVPVSSESISAAKRGEWELFLTNTIPVPRNWYPNNLKDLHILCLASGGGQQAPILAAAGAKVTVFDNAPMQLEKDAYVAERDGLDLKIVEGDMRDLSVFSDESFDLIFHPVSNCFIPDTQPVWKEAYRVLHQGGTLLSGFNNPVIYIFDLNLIDQGTFKVKYPLPYSDLYSLTNFEREKFIESGAPLEFSHSLTDQIGGQIQAGFVIIGFYEDIDPDTILGKYFPSFIATKALKPKHHQRLEDPDY